MICHHHLTLSSKFPKKRLVNTPHGTFIFKVIFPLYFFLIIFNHFIQCCMKSINTFVAFFFLFAYFIFSHVAEERKYLH